MGQLLYQLHADKVQHFLARSPTKDDANSRYDDKLSGFSVGLGLTLDQKSPGGAPTTRHLPAALCCATISGGGN